jgi:hypothetical protein
VFSYVSLEERVPQQHPLRSIRKLVDEIFRAMGKEFDAVCQNGSAVDSSPENRQRLPAPYDTSAPAPTLRSRSSTFRFRNVLMSSSLYVQFSCPGTFSTSEQCRCAHSLASSTEAHPQSGLLSAFPVVSKEWLLFR